MGKGKDLDISVVVPLLNEESSLVLLYRRLTEALDNLSESYELIFVDDGSTDSSFSALEQLHERDDRVKVIQFRGNYGKAAALSAGFRNSRGDVIITLDADLQDQPEEIPRFLAKLEEGYDLVSGWKANRHDPISKVLPSRVFNVVTSLMTGIKLHDFNCGFKCYRREVIEEIEVYGELHRFFPALAKMAHFRVGEIVVEHSPRQYGKSKYGPARLSRVFIDFFTVMFLMKFRKKPGHLFGGAGLLASFIGICINLYIAYLRLTFGNIQNRQPLLLLGILLMVMGTQFISIGLLGELITHTHARGRDEYRIRNKLGFDSSHRSSSLLDYAGESFEETKTARNQPL